jgi:hypothetical protein
MFNDIGHEREDMGKERFILGIYNYCDYWCERCAFTRQCRTFAMGKGMESERKSDRDDATNMAFWNNLADQLNQTSIMQGEQGWLQTDWRDDDGLDANDFLHEEEDEAEMDEYMRKDEALRQQVNQHLLSRIAMEYMQRVQAWLKDSDLDLKALAQEWMEATKTPDQDCDYEELARSVGDMLEVITWYHSFLAPKVNRALRSHFEMKTRERGILAESSQSDANGSGKVVLIAVERSISAWLFLREHLPKQEDAILSMLVILGRIRNGIHEELPNAKSFCRPGFENGTF